MKLSVEQQYILPVLHSQYHACWCSGDFRSQCISRHGIDSQSRNILSPASEELRLLRQWVRKTQVTQVMSCVSVQIVQTQRKLFSFYRIEEGFQPDFKHEYTQEFYLSYSFFISKCPRTGKFCGVCCLHCSASSLGKNVSYSSLCSHINVGGNQVDLSIYQDCGDSDMSRAGSIHWFWRA